MIALPACNISCLWKWTCSGGLSQAKTKKEFQHRHTQPNQPVPLLILQALHPNRGWLVSKCEQKWPSAEFVYYLLLILFILYYSSGEIGKLSRELLEIKHSWNTAFYSSSFLSLCFKSSYQQSNELLESEKQDCLLFSTFIDSVLESECEVKSSLLVFKE